MVSAGPAGEIASVEEANEIRVVFSEPMIALGTVPPRLRPSFFHITPTVAGTFRWSGTTILIFTPAKRLPLATKYDVRIDAGLAAVSGRRLAAPYTFSFITPTARLLKTEWYRPGGRFDAAPIVVLRFNQPVKGEAVAPHIRPRFESHQFIPPVISQAARERMRMIDPGSVQAFEDKVGRARAAAAATEPVTFEIAKEWDRKKFAPSPDMVVLQLTAPVPPDSWVRIETDGQVPSLAGLAVSGLVQHYTVQVEPTLFVQRLCETACDPDARHGIEFRVPIKVAAFAAALKATDITDPRRERPLAKSTPRQRESWELDESEVLSPEDAGFPSQPPASTTLLSLPADLKASDGQVLGYAWAAPVENWHQRAFTSFGDGHGVWEKGGGALLPFYARNFQNVTQWAAPVDPQQLMPTVKRFMSEGFRSAPTGPVRHAG